MSRPLILSDEDGKKYNVSNIRTQGWLDGHVPGAEVAIGFIMNLAVERFRQGNMEEATKLRNLVEEMKAKILPDLKNNAKRHEKDYPEDEADE